MYLNQKSLKKVLAAKKLNVSYLDNLFNIAKLVHLGFFFLKYLLAIFFIASQSALFILELYKFKWRQIYQHLEGLGI